MSETLIEAEAEDLRRLHSMLRKLAESDGGEFAERLSRRDEARILDLACGGCHEAELLARFLAELKSESGAAAGGTVRLTGVDVRAREIADAQRRFGGVRLPPSGAFRTESEFLVGDASKLEAHRELGEDYDLVFLRHQNYWNGARTWEEIYDRALEKLGEDGRLVITSYFDQEHELALQAIRRLGGELVGTARNPVSRALPTPGKSVDRHVAVFRKQR